MRGARWWSVVGLLAGVVSIGATVWWAWRTLVGPEAGMDPAADVGQVLGVPVAVAALVVTVLAWALSWRRRGLEEIADSLAAAVAGEVSRRQALALGPLLGRANPALRPVRVRDGSTGADARDPVDLWSGTPHRRLVVTGEAGIGKSVLLAGIVLGQVTGRAPGGPVATPFTLTGWDPARHDAETWLAARLRADYGLRAATGLRLVRAGLIVAVLDGLDELDADGTTRAAGVLRRLNEARVGDGTAPPMVVACRTDRYRALRAEGVTLLGGVDVELAPVDRAGVADYLDSLAPDAADPAGWRHVTDAVRAGSRAGRTLATALGPPWYLHLAATVYSTGDPRDLTRARSIRAVREHLTARFVLRGAELTAQRCGVPEERAYAWLHRVARIAARPPGRDLLLHEWWRHTRPHAAAKLHGLTIAVLVMAVGLVFASLNAAPLSLGVHDVGSFLAGVQPPRWPSALGALASLPIALFAMLVSGEPLQPMRLPNRRPTARRFAGAAGVFSAVTVVVSMTGLVPGAVGAGITLSFLYLCFTPFDRADASGPTGPLRGDRTYGLVLGVVAGLSGTVVLVLTAVARTLLGPDGFTARPGLMLAMPFLGFAVAAAFFAPATVRHLIASQLAAGGGRLPRRPGRFLAAAAETGLLRTCAAAYQFRQAEVADWLAAHPRPPAEPAGRRRGR